MSLGLWLRYLARWTGGVSGSGPDQRDGQTGDPVQDSNPSVRSAVLQDALAASRIHSEVQAALAAYRAALQTLSPRAGPRPRAGALEQAQRSLERIALPSSLGAALEMLKLLLEDCADVVFRGLLIGGKRPALLVFIDGMVEEPRIELSVLEPLVRRGDPEAVTDGTDLARWLEGAALTINNVDPVETVGQVMDAVLGGDAVLLVDGLQRGAKLSSRGWQQRAVEEPVSEGTIRGPREGFVESIRTNTVLLRRRIHSPHLKFVRVMLGRRTRTLVDVIYLKDVASPHLVDEVKTRLRRIDVDGIIDSGMIEELIEDQPSSIFPQVLSTERPDRVAAGILDGKVAILADGSPFVLTVPATFWDGMHAGEDYYERFWVGTLLLWLRYLFLITALVAPSLYIAITTMHQEMLPTALLLSVAASREGIPFPALVEALIMEVAFEGLREAGVRLPRPVGQAVSIVGALVVGQAAVQAGLVSPPMVIIVSITGIASFTIPRFSLGVAVRTLRFPLMFLAGTLGIFGIIVGLLAILIHMCALRSFGVPYLQPIAPLTWADLKDVLVRAPVWLTGHRSATNESVNRRRQAPWLKPGPGK